MAYLRDTVVSGALTVTDNVTGNSFIGDGSQLTGIIPYGECATAGGTAAKTVTVSPAITSLTSGQIIAVRFIYGNTADALNNTITLNVNSLGAKTLLGQIAQVGSAPEWSWHDGQTVLIRYDGTYWNLLSTPYIEGATSTNSGLMTYIQYNKLTSLSVPTTLTVSLSNSSWATASVSGDSYTTVSQTVTATGVTANNNIIVTPVSTNGIREWCTAGVKCITQAANSLTFYADTTPTMTITVNVLIL